MRFLSEAGQQALEQGAEAIEAVSSAEIAIAIRPRARYSLMQHATVGVVAAIGALAFAVYTPALARWLVLVLPVIAGVLGALLVELVPPLYRFVAPPWLRLEHVREAAYAAFVERRVHGTRDRTGILVYIALRERMVELVGDLAIVDKVGIEGLAAWAGTLEAHLPRGAEAFGKALGQLAPELAKTFPRRADDVNELANAAHVYDAPADANKPSS
jgi:putative membrane protein